MNCMLSSMAMNATAVISLKSGRHCIRLHCVELDNADIIIDTNCLTFLSERRNQKSFHFDNYQLMVIIASLENSKEWNSKRHRVVPQQELERQARIVDWPNLTDHYNGWNNIRYYYKYVFVH